MNAPLSPNTQAILLLTAPLIVGRGATSQDLLSLGDYKRLAQQLRALGMQPGDLLGNEAAQVLERCASVVASDRLSRLLGRGFLLGQAVARWQARAIWVVSRADPAYPRRLKARLREDSPPLLYGCGDVGLLDTGGLAVVGSRHVDDALVDYTREVGRLAAQSGRTIVSGGAKGVDSAAMCGALEAGGRVCGVLADSLDKAVTDGAFRNALREGRLVLASPCDPAAGFDVGHAMQRNKLIYALADASLVVSAEFKKGGTWAGATEQLDKLRFAPVYVRAGDEASKGLRALRDHGALPWPEPRDAQSLDAVLVVREPEPAKPGDGQPTLFD